MRTEKEACGIPLLGAFVSILVGQLTKKGTIDFKLDMEFPVVRDKVKHGTKPASDGAICAIVSCDSEYRPVVLYEYKPRVDTRLDYVGCHDLMELLLQLTIASTNIKFIL